MKIQITDNKLHKNFRPISLTRPISEIRFGILTIYETWFHLLNSIENCEIKYETESYLVDKYPTHQSYDFLIAGNIKPTQQLIDVILKLDNNQSLYKNNIWIATKGLTENSKIEFKGDILVVNEIWELFQKNDQAIQIDFEILTSTRTSEKISSTNQINCPENIFIEAGATVECSILNAKNGPIYIGKDAEIMEGSMVRGPFAILDHGTLKMGAKIYGATTIGPHCKIGGEVSNCIFQAYSNKGHDGFLGNSIIGEWCNFGADTNSSNLKNNYGKIKIYSYRTNQLEQTENMFCGVLMGDHSKTGINTMLNTATTVGVSANIFGGEFPPKFINSFSWGGFENSPKFKLEKAFEVAQNMMSRRGLDLSNHDKNILTYIVDNNL